MWRWKLDAQNIVFVFMSRSLLLTLYGVIKTAEQWTIIQQYGDDWYIGS